MDFFGRVNGPMAQLLGSPHAWLIPWMIQQQNHVIFRLL
jgi:hypothetical protein